MANSHDAELKKLHDEIVQRREKIVELIKNNPTPIDKNYTLFEGEDRPVALGDLFGDKDDLILVHNMGKGCVYCTLWADEINGIHHHLQDRASFVMVSPNKPSVQREFAESRGWKFRMLSDRDMDFTFDMGFAMEKEGKRYAQPGFSTFHREPDGSIVRVGWDHFGPGDMYSAVWHFYEMLKDGSKDWQPEYSYEQAEA